MIHATIDGGSGIFGPKDRYCSLLPLSKNCGVNMEEVIRPDALFEQEMRATMSGWSPAERHTLAQSVPINVTIPEDVQRLLVTAKNLLIYACFYYPFNITAMHTALSALELAIRKKAQSEGVTSKLSGLHGALEMALKHQWISDDGMSNIPVRRALVVRANGEREYVEDLTAGPYVDVLKAVLPKIRNLLAHGSGYLDSDGASKVLVVNELINQMFPVSLP
jgi:hypothetical protein